MSPTQCPYCAASLTATEAQQRLCGSCRRELPSGIQTEPNPWPEGSPAQAYPPAPSGVFQPSEERRPWREVSEGLPDLRKGGDWSGVHAGLGLLVFGLVTNLICQVLSIVPQLITVNPGMRQGATCLSLVVALGQLAAGIIMLVGMIRTVLAPEESGLRGLGLSSLICTLIAIALIIGTVVIFVAAIGRNMRGGGPPQLDEMLLVVVALVVLAGLLIFVGSLLFFIYLRAVACYFGNPSLGSSFIAYFVISMLFLVAMVGGLAVLSVLARRPQDAVGAMLLAACVMLVGGVALMGWLISLYNRLRTLIGERQERPLSFPG